MRAFGSPRPKGFVNESQLPWRPRSSLQVQQSGQLQSSEGFIMTTEWQRSRVDACGSQLGGRALYPHLSGARLGTGGAIPSKRWVLRTHWRSSSMSTGFRQIGSKSTVNSHRRKHERRSNGLKNRFRTTVRSTNATHGAHCLTSPFSECRPFTLLMYSCESHLPFSYLTCCLTKPTDSASTVTPV